MIQISQFVCCQFVELSVRFINFVMPYTWEGRKQSKITIWIIIEWYLANIQIFGIYFIFYIT